MMLYGSRLIPFADPMAIPKMLHSPPTLSAVSADPIPMGDLPTVNACRFDATTSGAMMHHIQPQQIAHQQQAAQKQELHHPYQQHNSHQQYSQQYYQQENQYQANFAMSDSQQCTQYSYGSTHSMGTTFANDQHQQGIAAVSSACQYPLKHEILPWSDHEVPYGYVPCQEQSFQQQQQLVQPQAQQQKPQNQSQQQYEFIHSADPSPAFTGDSGEISHSDTSVGTSPQHISDVTPEENNNTTPIPDTQRTIPNRTAYGWMKRTQLNPNTGKTRTKDKYRAVYTEYQRLELEKEFCFNNFISTSRKAELSAVSGLSDRQIKIWFQNRRAKNRKQNRKRNEMAQQALTAYQQQLQQQQQEQQDQQQLQQQQQQQLQQQQQHLQQHQQQLQQQQRQQQHHYEIRSIPANAAAVASHDVPAPPIVDMASLSLHKMNAMLSCLTSNTPTIRCQRT